MRTLLLFLTAAAAFGQSLGFPGPGTTYAVPGYTHEYTVTLGNSSLIPATQTNFTVLVCANLTLGNGTACATATGLAVTGSGGAVTSSAGYDINFSSTACATPTLMTWEMVNYTGSTGAMEAYVLVPSLAASGTFYICAGLSSISTFQGGSAGAAWNSSYQGVYHMPNGSTLTSTDSTANAVNLTVHSGGSVPATTGQIDGGASFDAGSGDYLQNTTGFTTITGNPLTIQAWIRVNSGSAGSPDGMIQIGNGGASTRSMLLDYSSSGGGRVEFNAYGKSSVYFNFALGTYANTWHFLVGVLDGSQIAHCYLDGTATGSSATQSWGIYLGTGYNQAYVGTGPSDAAVFNGHVDEARVSNVALSANWIATEFHNQSAPATFAAMVLTY